MRILSKLACLTVLGLLISKTTVPAAEIPINNLPDDIKQMLATINATPVSAHERDRRYEVTVKNPDGSMMELVFKTAHVLVTVETPVNSVPPAVANAVVQRYPGSTILYAEQMMSGANAPSGFKLQILQNNNQTKWVHILPTGQYFHTPNDRNQAQTTQQVQQLVNDANAAIRAKQFDVANNKLQQANQLAPLDRDVQRAMNDLNQAIGTQSPQQVRQLVNDAHAAIRAKQFDVANNKLQLANQLAPQDRDVQRAMNDLNQAIGTQSPQQVRQLVNDAHAAIRAKQFDVASNKLQLANQLAPQDRDVQRAMNDLNQAMATATSIFLKANIQGSNRVHPGDNVQVQVTVDRGRTDSFQGPISLALNNLPSGIVSQNTDSMIILQGQNTALINLTVQSTAPSGDNEQIKITGQAVGVPNATTHSATCTISVHKPK